MAPLSPRARALLRDVPDFPSPGILFRDVGPLLADAEALAEVVAGLAAQVGALGATAVAGIEARGFVLGAAAAVVAGVGFVPLRKAGKLPGETLREDYALEYGTATLELQAGVLAAGTAVLVVDDVLATGGTAAAAAALLGAAGLRPVGLAVLLEIVGLAGRSRLAPLRVSSTLAV